MIGYPSSQVTGTLCLIQLFVAAHAGWRVVFHARAIVLVVQKVIMASGDSKQSHVRNTPLQPE